MRYTTVIFDLDGTLLNTLEDIRDSVNHILTKYGYPARTLEEIRLRAFGKIPPQGAGDAGF